MAPSRCSRLLVEQLERDGRCVPTRGQTVDDPMELTDDRVRDRTCGAKLAKPVGDEPDGVGELGMTSVDDGLEPLQAGGRLPADWSGPRELGDGVGGLGLSLRERCPTIKQ